VGKKAPCGKKGGIGGSKKGKTPTPGIFSPARGQGKIKEGKVRGGGEGALTEIRESFHEGFCREDRIFVKRHTLGKREENRICRPRVQKDDSEGKAATLFILDIRRRSGQRGKTHLETESQFF